jgi:hypothetical protein
MSIVSVIPHRESFACSTQEAAFNFGAGDFGSVLARTCGEVEITVRALIQTCLESSSLDGIPDRSSVCSSGETDLPLLVGFFNRSMHFDNLVALTVDASFNRMALSCDIFGQFSKQLAWRKNLFLITPFIALFSRVKSATVPLSSVSLASGSLIRLSSEASSPPYWPSTSSNQPS